MNAYVGGRILKKTCISGGGGSFLLGNMGGQVGAGKIDPPEKLAGAGLSQSLGRKLAKLEIKPMKKTKNIVFDI